MIERTLVILKPDVSARGFIGEIISRFEKVGLKIVGMKMLMAPEEVTEKHYAKDDEWLMAVGKKLIKNQDLDPDEDPMEHGKMIQRSLVKDLMTYPIIALVLEGHNTVKLVRKMVGAQSPQDSEPGTIRGDYSQDTYRLANALNRPVINLIHASDSRETAEKEIQLWFDEDEIVEWEHPHEKIHFREHGK